MSDPVINKREGPGITIRASCFGCRYETSQPFRCQGDSGSYVYCNHPSIGNKYVASYSWDTPDWCPFTPPRLGDREAALEAAAQIADVPALSGYEIAQRIRSLK